MVGWPHCRSGEAEVCIRWGSHSSLAVRTVPELLLVVEAVSKAKLAAALLQHCFVKE